jgi:hypothetical protein
MTRILYRKQVLRSYLLSIFCRDIFSPTEDLDDRLQEINLDTATLITILQSRYLRARLPVPKAGNIHLAFQFAETDPTRFAYMLRLTPTAFRHILSLIHDHPVFTTRSNSTQAPVQYQLAVALYRAGRYGNGASVQDVARTAGISEGSVVNFTNRCMRAILSLEPTIMQKITEEEKEMEKAWVEDQVGCPSFRDGWCTGDGTLIPLCQKPGLNGDAYFSRKSRYDLNVQVCGPRDF